MTVWTEQRDWGQLSRWRLPLILSGVLHLCLLQVLLSARDRSMPPILEGSSAVTVMLAGPESPGPRVSEKEPTPAAADLAPPTLAEPMRISVPVRDQVTAPVRPVPARSTKALAAWPITLAKLPAVSRVEPGMQGTAGNVSAPAATGSAAAGAGPGATAGTLRQAEPRATGNRPPDYPSLARKRGWQGRVVLAVDVDRDGAAQAVRVESGSGHGLLDEAALRAVQDWRFEPASRDGQPVAMRVLVPVSFVLRDHS